MLLAGYPVGGFFPTYKMLSETWRQFIDVFAPIRNNKNEQEHRLELVTGGVLEMWSLDAADTARGRKYKRVFIDEAAMIPNLMDIWNAVIRPMLIDYKGDAFIKSTPKGHNGFWQMYQLGNDPKNSEWKSWQFQTAENPYIPQSEIAAMKASMPEIIFRQEIMAEFIESDGAVFRRVQEAAHVERLDKPKKGRQYAAGVDVAAAVDYTVVTVMDVASKEAVFVDRFNRVDYNVLIDRLEAAYKHWRMTVMKIESNSIGQPVIDALRARGMNIVPFTTTGATKQVIIQNLQAAFENSQLGIIDDPILIGELLSFESKRNASGSFSYSAPDGMHDDCLLAGTLIKTDEGYKSIENIKVGDLVLTHTGNFKRVEALIKKPFSGQFYKVKPACNLTLGISYNHPLYAAKRDYSGDLSGEFNRRDWVLPGDWKKTYRTVCIKQQIENQTLFELSEDDYYQNGKLSGNIKLRKIEINKDFALLTGRFVADGHCRKYGFYSMELAFNHNEQDDIRFYLDYINGLGVKARYERMSGTNGGKIIFSSKLLYHIFLDTYNENGERKLPKWVWRIGKLVSGVYEGWIAADGCETRGHLIGCSTSKQLALEIRDIAMAIGKYATIQELRNRKRYGKPSKDQCWVAVHDKWMFTAGQRKVSDFEYISTAKVGEYFYEGDVYNLQVADDRSFIANGIVVHNCVMSLAITWDAVNNNGSVILFGA